jgi:Fe-S-cluster containining protein
VKHTGKSVSEIVRFCPSSEMAYDDESGLWIRFKLNRRAMVLRKRRGRCIFQTDGKACSAYAARPQTCRTFPYSIDLDGNEISEIRLNKVMACNAVKCSTVDIDAMVTNVKKENREDKEYHRLVKQWNTSDNAGTVKFFLKHLGL